MLDVYTVVTPPDEGKEDQIFSILENFLSYDEADAFRNECHAGGFDRVVLSHRSVSAKGGSLEQRADVDKAGTPTK